MRRAGLRTAVVALAAALATALVGIPTAGADTTDISPPGANNWSCAPSTAHPYPVVLVPGTFESMAKNWSTLSPVLAEAGYCVFALNYGTTNGVPATGPIADSAQELGSFVDAVLGATGARKVDLVGHSQGGMMPRYYMHLLGGAKKVHALVGIAPSNHGTQGLITPAPDVLPSTSGGSQANPLCQACDDQQAGSPFLQTLNARGDTVSGPYYTVLSTVYDEVVTPYTSQALAGPAKRVTNITIQDACPADPFEHDQMPNDPVVHQWVLQALSQRKAPADPAFRPVCL